jgi:hypothetical protein
MTTAFGALGAVSPPHASPVLGQLAERMRALAMRSTFPALEAGHPSHRAADFSRRWQLPWSGVLASCLWPVICQRSSRTPSGR